MKCLVIFFIGLMVSVGNARPQANSRTHSFQFPKYNRPVAPRSSRAAPVYHVAAHHDSLGNHITDDHMNRVDFARNRAETVMKNDIHVTDVVRVGRAHYTNYFRPAFDQKRAFFTTFLAPPLPILNVWRAHYFYGGFYYGFHPVLDIDTYFYNPTVYWFYVGTFDEAYYRSWYQDYYAAYPEFHTPFQYHGVFYPTDNLRQLLFGVSAMPADKQAHFRDAIVYFAQRVAQTLANGLRKKITLSQGDIAVTHYEIIGYDDAIVLEGMVTHNNKTYNFKGLLDLEHPNNTPVFMPVNWNQEPNQAELAQLDELNSQISVVKGEPLQPPAANPSDAVVPPAGEVTAEPSGN